MLGINLECVSESKQNKKQKTMYKWGTTCVKFFYVWDFVSFFSVGCQSSNTFMTSKSKYKQAKKYDKYQISKKKCTVK